MANEAAAACHQLRIQAGHVIADAVISAGHGLNRRSGMLWYNVMIWRLTDPLALAAGAGARMILAAGVAGALWGAVLWALAA